MAFPGGGAVWFSAGGGCNYQEHGIVLTSSIVFKFYRKRVPPALYTKQPTDTSNDRCWGGSSTITPKRKERENTRETNTDNGGSIKTKKKPRCRYTHWRSPTKLRATKAPVPINTSKKGRDDDDAAAKGFPRGMGTILGKRKGDGDDIDEIPSKKPKCPPPPPRNRASPSSLLLACKDMPQDRQDAIDEMDFTSLQNIKCVHLSNGLNVWLAGLDDLESREVVVPGRGRLPVKEEYVHRVMGVPRGGKDIPYNIPTKADIKLGLDMFGEFGYTHKMTELLDLITSSDNSDTNFKRMWLMLAGNTIIAPTTSKKVNPRWYVVLRNIDDVKNLNWSKFIADEPHKAVSKGKPTKGCILFYNLLYIHAIDLSGLGIVLPVGPFPINV
ncbi:hypothetical protein TRIUR3_35193 [Triticum urartu]|uniref:Uncharacterized protein n=1 Tax=Triticum urartu TaxID=4572 RepID=M7ZG88_TRIUA|nr:hypothetical protein TRIUR3_35193 [Triticum urartu]